EPTAKYRKEPKAHLPSVPRTELPTSRSIRMITSVSILLRMIGAATAVNLSKGFGMLASHGPDVGDDTGDRSRRSAGWTCQMSARPRPLAPDKIAVGGRD